MQVRQLDAPFGVEVSGFDATAPLSAEVEVELNSLIDRHRLLLVRGQEIDADAHIRLVDTITPVVPEVASGQKYTFNGQVDDAFIPGSFGLIFHSDYMFRSHGPIQALSLCALVMERPEPTMFCDSVRAAKSLPAEMRERLRTLNVVQIEPFSVTPVRHRVSEAQHLPKERLKSGVYGALVTHPRTGEEVLMHSELMTSHFEGLSDEESDELFAEIVPLQYVDENMYQHEYQEGDLLIWDNIALQHGRPPLATTSNRLLRRVAGDPVPV